MPRLTPPTDIALVDPTADRVRRSHAQAIRELQAETLAASGVGRLLAVQLIAESGTYVPTKGTRTVVVSGGGGGGGGGGATAAAASLSAAGGGASGTCIRFAITSTGDITGGPVTVGAPGAGGAAAGGNGATGGSGTIIINGVTYTATGGGGGQGSAASGALSEAFGGGPVAGSSSVGTFESRDGEHGRIYDVSLGGAGFQGRGASSPFGSGGQRAGTNVTPSAPSGFCGGGAGARAVGGSASGGAGAPGIWILEEYS